MQTHIKDSYVNTIKHIQNNEHFTIITCLSAPQQRHQDPRPRGLNLKLAHGL